MLVFVLARRAPTIRPPPRRRAWFTMLDDADSAEPLRGDSAKRIRSASPVKPIRFVNVFDLLAPARRASSSIVVRVVRALHLTEVGLAVVPWRRRFPRAALARKASTRRQEATSGSLSWRNRIHPHSAGDGVCGNRHSCAATPKASPGRLNSS
jgi:hypothetical protein